MDANLEAVLGPRQLETCRARHRVAEQGECKEAARGAPQAT